MVLSALSPWRPAGPPRHPIPLGSSPTATPAERAPGVSVGELLVVHSVSKKVPFGLFGLDFPIQILEHLSLNARKRTYETPKNYKNLVDSHGFLMLL